MKYKGNGVVWDSVKNKPLCKFVNGEFETNDSYIIGVLESKGYIAEYTEQPKQEIKKKPSKIKGAE